MCKNPFLKVETFYDSEDLKKCDSAKTTQDVEFSLTRLKPSVAHVSGYKKDITTLKRNRKTT